VLEACRYNLESLRWCDNNNREVARTSKFIFCDALDGLSHDVRGQCALGLQVCYVVWGWACGLYSSHLGGGYPEIPLLEYVGVGAGVCLQCRRATTLGHYTLQSCAPDLPMLVRAPEPLVSGVFTSFCKPGIRLNNCPQDASLLLLRRPSVGILVSESLVGLPGGSPKAE